MTSTADLTQEQLDNYYSYEAGYNDRIAGKLPSFSDNYYFQGYAARIQEEAAIDMVHRANVLPRPRRTGFACLNLIATLAAAALFAFAIFNR